MAYIQNKPDNCEAQCKNTVRQNSFINTYGETISYIEKFGSPMQRAKIRVLKKLLEGGG